VNAARSEDLNERVFENRTRLELTLQPVGWLRAVAGFQDARLAGAPYDGIRSDAADLRLAFVEAGRSERGWSVAAGRQELAVGDERLVGADSEWDPLGLTFDAVRVSYTSGRWQGMAFTGYRVTAGRGRLNHHDSNNRLSGLVFEWGGGGKFGVQPYLFWRRSADSADLAGRPGTRSVWTPGLAVRGELPRGLDYNVEMAVQRGCLAGGRIAAWAGHWGLGWRPMGPDIGPRIEAEFDFASGDAEAEDRKHGTFDDLFPAGFNAFGLTDPYAWRNIRYPGVSAEIPVTRKWSLRGGYRSYWLATIQDGLYLGGDTYSVRMPDAPGTHIGSMILISAT
jgi:hypothetical protein